jgi:short-subunit dehydrogenase
MDLSGRVAVITGGSSGIGLAVGRLLGRHGVAVVLGARRRERLEAAVDDIRRAGGRADYAVTDVTSLADVDRLTQRATDAFGRLDIMICNAGFGFYGTVEQTPAETMQRMMDVNFMGTFYGARAALPLFRAQGHGHLLVVSSIVGQRGIALMSGYSATKAAQVGFVEALRTEFAGTRIAVSVVFPVSTETEFRDAMTRDYGHTVSGLGPKQSMDEVARAVLACVQHPRAEVYPHRAARALAIVNAIAPAFTDRLVRKYGRRREGA